MFVLSDVEVVTKPILYPTKMVAVGPSLQEAHSKESQSPVPGTGDRELPVQVRKGVSTGHGTPRTVALHERRVF